MKRIIALFLSAALMVPASIGYAAGKVSKFELVVAQDAKVGEAVDLTVTALGSDGEAVQDYAGTIYVTVDNDSKATVPYADGYTFTSADQGKKTFSKGLSFSKAGSMTVSVIDIDDDKVEGVAKVNVTVGGGDTGPAGSETVTITNPEPGSTVSGGDINVTGTTKKNSKYQVFLNGKQVGESQTDDKGAILYALKNVEQEQNVISVKVLDGNDKVVGESPKVSFAIAETKGPQFVSVSIQEGKQVTVGTILHATVVAEPKLKEVLVALGDSVEVFKEQSEGTYVGTLTAPAVAGSYPIDVTLTNDLGKKTVKAAAETIATVEVAKPEFANILPVATEGQVSFTFEVQNDLDKLNKFKFVYGTESGSLSKESVTFEKAKIMTGGTYAWYVSGLEVPVKHYFKIKGLDVAGSEIGLESNLIEVEMGLNAAGKCSIGNVAGLKAATDEEKTVLTWTPMTDALGYNVYKKDASGTFVLIENVRESQYVVHLAKDAVKYEDFAVKAVCADGATESADYAELTRVQTGPAQLALLFVLALGMGYFITRRNFAFFRRG